MSSKVTGFSRHNPLKGKSKKPPESGGFLRVRRISAIGRLQPLGAAVAVTVAARSAIPVIAAIPVAATVTVVALKPR